RWVGRSRIRIAGRFGRGDGAVGLGGHVVRNGIRIVAAVATGGGKDQHGADQGDSHGNAPRCRTCGTRIRTRGGGGRRECSGGACVHIRRGHRARGLHGLHVCPNTVASRATAHAYGHSPCIPHAPPD